MVTILQFNLIPINKQGIKYPWKDMPETEDTDGNRRCVAGSWVGEKISTVYDFILYQH